MKHKIAKIFTNIEHYSLCYFAGIGAGFMVLRILKVPISVPDFKKESLRTKVLYGILSTVLAVPAVLYLSTAKMCVDEKIDEEFDDEI